MILKTRPSNIGGGTGIIALTKTGSGTTTLTGANTYTGPTVVSAGTLIVQGSIQGAGMVNVNTGTLGGTGSIAGILNLGDATGSQDAVIAPGPTGAAGIGTLTTSNAITFASDAVFSLQINTDGTPATDLLTTTGPISLGLGVATLNVANLGTTMLTSGQVFTFIHGSSVTGQFAGEPDGSQFSVGTNIFQIKYTSTSVALLAAPEPASAAFLLGGLGTLVGFQRIRRRAR